MSTQVPHQTIFYKLVLAYLEGIHFSLCIFGSASASTSIVKLCWSSPLLRALSYVSMEAYVGLYTQACKKEILYRHDVNFKCT